MWAIPKRHKLDQYKTPMSHTSVCCLLCYSDIKHFTAFFFQSRQDLSISFSDCLNKKANRGGMFYILVKSSALALKCHLIILRTSSGHSSWKQSLFAGNAFTLPHLWVTSHFWARLPVIYFIYFTFYFFFGGNQLLLGKPHVARSWWLKRLRLIKQGARSLFSCLAMGQTLCAGWNMPLGQDV